MLLTLLIALFALVLIVWALIVLVGRRRRLPVAESLGRHSLPRPPDDTSTPWNRQDRLALASLVIGTLLAIVALIVG